MAHVNAWNTRRGREQSVPAHWVDNPHIFDGVFTREKPAPKSTATPPKARKSRAKNSRRKAGTADAPATDEAATTTTSTPVAGESTKEK